MADMSIPQALCAAQDGKCFYCPLEFEGKSTNDNRKRGWTLDHVRPESKGHGYAWNVVLACCICNSKKSDRDPTDEELARAAKVHETAVRLFTNFNGHAPPQWKPKSATEPEPVLAPVVEASVKLKPTRGNRTRGDHEKILREYWNGIRKRSGLPVNGEPI